jgi:DNA-3-methyladenine glycosylase I
MKRCNWSLNQFEAYQQYHDTEWGVPVYDDRTHFEFLILEGAQAGLSWATILKKRQGYRDAFANWDVTTVANYTDEKIQELIANPNIVRNKLKIKGAVTNAQKFITIQKEFGSFSNYIWSFVNHTPIVNHWSTASEVPATSAQSDALSKDLKKRGFKFCGSTIMYAHMQATGLVNDHETSCFRYHTVQSLSSKNLL